jgi:hypothetical protein
MKERKERGRKLTKGPRVQSSDMPSHHDRLLISTKDSGSKKRTN